jgi:serine protease inhibitor/uncharacterized protein involved in exopolysaccharide biosynthesis
MNSRRIIGVVALIIGLGLCGKGLMLLLAQTYYEAVVKVETQPDLGNEVSIMSSSGNLMPFEPYFMETELKAIQSEAVLSNVVQALNLDVEWGKRYGNGTSLETGEAIKLVRRQMALSADGKTHNIEIHIIDKDPDMSARIANAIADAYKQYRIEQYKERMNKGIEKLEEDYRTEETNIWTMQSNVLQLHKELNINDTNDTDPAIILGLQARRHYSELLIEGQESYAKLASQLADLQAIQATNPIMLREVLPTIINDSELSDLLTRLRENQQKLAAETNFSAMSNSDETNAKALVDELNKQIDTRIDGIMIGLKSNVNSQKAALDALSNQVADAETQESIAAAKEGPSWQARKQLEEPYWRAKRELGEKMNLHEMLGAKIEYDKGEAMVPRSDLVAIINPAVTPQAPAGPNRLEGAGLLIGGLGMSFFGMGLIRRGGRISGQPVKFLILIIPLLSGGGLVVYLLGCLAPRPGAPSSQARNLVKENTAFAIDLYDRLRTNDGNLFFSPYSISAALAMTYGGAQGNTAKQMAHVLHFDLPDDKLHPAFGELATNFDRIQKEGRVQISIANALWTQSGFTLRPDYVDLCQKYYGASIRPVDFGQPEIACKEINEWVAEKTNGKILDLMGPGAIDNYTRMVLVDAIYFKGNWVRKFDKRNTYDQKFSLVQGGVTVPFMSGTENFGYAKLPDLQVLEMPYSGEEFSMVMLLPNEMNGLARLEEQLTTGNLDLWTRKLKTQKVTVFMPKFKMTLEFQLAKTLAAMGMMDAFDAGKADFSAMDGITNLYISDVVHKAFVEVNEEGTEAAAATGVEVSTYGISDKPPVPCFVADHPFLFLIRDNWTGSILFLGRVMDPSK